MPIYEYVCKKCGTDFSKLVFKQDAEVECPACKSKEVEKKISALGNVGGKGSSGGCSSGGFT